MYLIEEVKPYEPFIEENKKQLAGQALKNKHAWRETIKYLKANGIFVEKWAEDFVESGEIDILDRAVCNFKRNRFKFNNKIYSTITALIQEYKSKSDVNYKGCVDNFEQCKKIIEEYLEAKIIRKAYLEELDNLVINPIKRGL